MSLIAEPTTNHRPLMEKVEVLDRILSSACCNPVSLTDQHGRYIGDDPDWNVYCVELCCATFEIVARPTPGAHFDDDKASVQFQVSSIRSVSS